MMQANKPGNFYPSAKLVACSVPLGVATLSLSHSNLTGSIEALDLSALALSLTRLDLSGALPALLLGKPSHAAHLPSDLSLLAGNQMTGGAGSLSALTGLTYLDGGSNQCKPPPHWVPPWSMYPSTLS